MTHDHDHHNCSLTEMEIRVRGLESLLLEKGYVDPKGLDALVEHYETKIGPRNGAKVVAKAAPTLKFAGGRPSRRRRPRRWPKR